ncbi:MAG: ribosomal-processing cysteine protease Prp [Alicyclobacillaceae bacterium]|nr:ribosomal-processing cysteine protease Prp [Alicyclobacillaceae bacterium]
MIRVRVERDPEEKIRRLKVSGHAGWSEAGQDIVCAAVSALTLNVVNSCRGLLGVALPFQARNGYLDLQVPEDLPEDVAERVQLLLESCVFGLWQTAERYKDHVVVSGQVKGRWKGC